MSQATANGCRLTMSRWVDYYDTPLPPPPHASAAATPMVHGRALSPRSGGGGSRRRVQQRIGYSQLLASPSPASSSSWRLGAAATPAAALHRRHHPGPAASSASAAAAAGGALAGGELHASLSSVRAEWEGLRHELGYAEERHAQALRWCVAGVPYRAGACHLHVPIPGWPRCQRPCPDGAGHTPR